MEIKNDEVAKTQESTKEQAERQAERQAEELSIKVTKNLRIRTGLKGGRIGTVVK